MLDLSAPLTLALEKLADVLWAVESRQAAARPTWARAMPT